MAFVIVAILGQFGVETTSIVALLGAAGLAVGLALQGAMSNLAAGVMLMIFRPYKVGDFVHHPIRGVEMKFNVAYDDDIAKAKAVIHKVLADNPHIVADPAPFVEVETLSERSAER